MGEPGRKRGGDGGLNGGRLAAAEGDGLSGLELAGLGLQFALAILAGLYGGRWLDSKLGTKPVFLLVGVFLGAAGTFYSVFRRLSRQERGGGDGGAGR